MKVPQVLVTLALVSLAVAGAIPKPGEQHKDRVIDKELSDEKHFDDDEHNPEYDHEAFLGKEEARDFEDLSPEESQERLGKIFDKIDKDANGKVSEEELKNWIKYVQNKYIIEDTERQWKEHQLDDNGQLTWAKYKERTYGYLESDTNDDEAHYKDMVDRDERRWKRADKNEDGALTKEEFMDFLHPEEAENMKDIVVEETLEDIDKNKDGYITEEEYIGDFYPDSDEGEPEPEWVKTERESFHRDHDKNGDGKMDASEIMSWIIPDDYDHTVAETQHLLQESDSDKEHVKFISTFTQIQTLGDMWPEQDGVSEPDWVRTEREQFKSFRDKNGDGRMDSSEVREWVMPDDYDHTVAESKHLIFESDMDRDGFLTKEEVVNKYDLFVGSQATDFGEALTRHDEF